MYNKIKFYFRLKNLTRKLKKENNKKDFIKDLKFNSYVLIIDIKIPEFNKDSGSRRLTEIIKILLKNKKGVFLMADRKEYRYKSEYIPYFKELGVIVYEPSLDEYGRLITRESFLEMVLKKTDFVWLHRPDIFSKYEPLIKKYNSKTKIFFDMVDFHYLRFKREASLTSNKNILKKANEYLKLELNNCQRADGVIVISDFERQVLKPYYDEDYKIFVVGNVHEHLKLNNFPGFEARKNLLFIGGFDHKPNVDCVMYLHDKIMPLVWEVLPNVSISILGSNPPPSVMALHSKNFKIIGYVEDVAPYFLNSKIFVAPLRYGAGIKGKIGQSLEYSLPLVTTQIGAEGFNFIDNKDKIIGNTSEEIATNIISIYKDIILWKKISLASEKVILPFSISHIEETVLSMINN
jgi:hypothetical protein